MMIVAKMNGRIVEVIRVADTVGFSTERGWVMVCMDFEPVSYTHLTLPTNREV